ncbi:hypothetical protein BBK82_20195 [Lentzea guizhouensis]|uniref:Uncharacterized protein n=1 Tax=Lentzea guizhouensis TaxID=1586287 RepID=A0A1B2HJY5_9PSEU|nr:hypothetical protein [Lentzea guizhouensis]ANZ38033.1 hypothetical protein BBK82_20195 [Lentzea guizhouensis]
MRDFDEPVRAAGPGVVVDGPAGAPTVLVIDPAGEAVHDGIPATWRPLTDTVRVVWLRVPAAPTWQSTVDKVLAAHRDDESPVRLDVVCSGPIAADVVDLVRRHEHLVNSVLLVDPETEIAAPFGKVIARTHPSADDRVPAPMPLGHPDVVNAVIERVRQ